MKLSTAFHHGVLGVRGDIGITGRNASGPQVGFVVIGQPFQISNRLSGTPQLDQHLTSKA